jgi:hypothetical protein
VALSSRAPQNAPVVFRRYAGILHLGLGTVQDGFGARIADLPQRLEFSKLVDFSELPQLAQLVRLEEPAEGTDRGRFPHSAPAVRTLTEAGSGAEDGVSVGIAALGPSE